MKKQITICVVVLIAAAMLATWHYLEQISATTYYFVVTPTPVPAPTMTATPVPAPTMTVTPVLHLQLHLQQHQNQLRHLPPRIRLNPRRREVL